MRPKTVEQLLLELESDPEREQLALELQALQSIYSEEDAISIWIPERSMPLSSSPADTVRLQIRTALSPPHESISFGLLVSLPRAYPASASPQFQILSRYVGAFQVDANLFGKILRTYMASDGVRFVRGEATVFDGVEYAREAIQRWYETRLSAASAAELLREDEKALANMSLDEGNPGGSALVDAAPDYQEPENNTAPKLPEGVRIYISEPVHDRKSTFVGRACRITSPEQVPIILKRLLEDKSIARATHPVINAWRCDVGGQLHQDNDDDGETEAGKRLAHLLHVLNLTNVLVVVTRYFGGTLLYGDRFKHINSVARAVLEEAGFLDGPNDPKRDTRTGAKGKRKP